MGHFSGHGPIYSKPVLKDKNGNAVTYEDGANIIKVPTSDGSLYPYHDLGLMFVYICRYGGEMITVVAKMLPIFTYAADKYGCEVLVSANSIKELGEKITTSDGTEDYRACILFTRKNLENGKSYSYDYVMKEDE